MFSVEEVKDCYFSLKTLDPFASKYFLWFTLLVTKRNSLRGSDLGAVMCFSLMDVATYDSTERKKKFFFPKKLIPTLVNKLTLKV